MSKIGIGVISVNRPEFFSQCMASLPKSDVVIEVINGERNYSVCRDKVFYQKKTQNVAANKNVALKFLLEEANCDHIFLCEDDIRFEDQNLCQKYIETSYLQMLCFRAEPLSEKQVVPYRKKEHIHEPRIIHVAHSPEYQQSNT